MHAQYFLMCPFGSVEITWSKYQFYKNTGKFIEEVKEFNGLYSYHLYYGRK